MPFPRDLLELVVCSHHPDASLETEKLQSLIRLWKQRGWIDDNGKCLDTLHLIEGGFAFIHVVIPERILLYANHQGGYRVQCPDTGVAIALQFSQAVECWRKGGVRSINCLCGKVHALEEVVLQPRGAFSNGAIIFRGVESVHLSSQAKQDILAILGETHLVYRRLS